MQRWPGCVLVHPGRAVADDVLVVAVVIGCVVTVDPHAMLLIDTVEIEHVAADMVTLNAAPPLTMASYRCPPLLVSVAPLAAPRVQPPDT
jgi:hypothetical protein